MLSILKRKPVEIVEPYEALDQQWVAERMNEAHFTPDVNMLETRIWQALFLCGEDQPGYALYEELIKPHVYLPEGKRPAVAFTRAKFSMWDKTWEEKESEWEVGDKVIVPLDAKFYGQNHACIKGYLVMVARQAIYDLDKHWRNRLEFIRRRESIIIPQTRYRWTKAHGSEPPEKTITKRRAWFYVGNPKFWDNHIDAGYSSQALERIRSRSPWTEDYIHYDAAF